MPTYFNASEHQIHFEAFGCRLTPSRLARLVDTVVGLWSECGYSPDSIAWRPSAWSGTGRESKWMPYTKARRAKFDADVREGVVHGSIAYGSPCISPESKSTLFFSFAVEKGHIVHGYLPKGLGQVAVTIDGSCARLATESACGAASWSRRPPQCIREKPKSAWVVMMNNEMSYARQYLRRGSGLLAGVYERNFLSEQQLEGRLGASSTTLREWVESEPDGRGELKAFTEQLTEWTPPIERIPELREELFRAGRLHYHLFFNEIRRRKGYVPTGPDDEGWKEPEPYYRANLDEPWEAKDEIPEAYRADFYRDYLANGMKSGPQTTIDTSV